MGAIRNGPRRVGTSAGAGLKIGAMRLLEGKKILITGGTRGIVRAALASRDPLAHV
jgi:hypothetical protein